MTNGGEVTAVETCGGGAPAEASTRQDQEVPNRAPISAAARMASPKPPDSDRPGIAEVSPKNAKDQPASSFDANDFEIMSHNAARLMDAGARVVAAYLKPIDVGTSSKETNEGTEEAFRSIGAIAEYWLSDPERAVAAQTTLATGFIDLWGVTWRRFCGEKVEPVSEPAPADKRFAAAEWKEQPFFDFLRQAYTLSSHWASDLVENAATVDPHTRNKAKFYVKQITGALSPSNFLPTNPEVLKETIANKGENLIRGMEMLAEDLARGNGTVKLRQSDDSQIEIGVNTATSPGKVVYRNDLMELIQYDPVTEDVLRRPLLIVPPWINKYYVLDLNPDRSFIGWAVAQGTTVFVISWVNPDARHAGKSFEHYMREGALEAIAAIEAAVGVTEVSALGYCVGGTLLAVTLAYMAATSDKRIAAATFLATQVDFTEPGDLKIFVDEEQVRAVEKKMEAKGYLDASSMANAFNMLRPNDLIWPYVVDQYLKGKPPRPFDLLSWNADQTRMPAANHSFYLRNCYLNNTLSRGEMVVAGERLDLHKVDIPVYFLSMREDHIAPARSCFVGAKLFGGPVQYVMSGSGHIAGAVNPPDKGRYPHWVGPRPEGDFDAWVAAAEQRMGSWWPHWHAWMTGLAPERTPARAPGAGALQPLCEAPGTYVRVRA